MTPTGQNLDVDELLGELRDWLSANWDPDSTLGEWWERLGLAGWSSPNLPVGAYGKGVSRSDAVAVAKQIAAGLVGIEYPAGYGTLISKLLTGTSVKHETRTDWRRRPLSQRQIAYALM